MYEWLFGLLLAHPKAFIAVGRTLFSIAGVFALLGLRLDRIEARIGRVAERTHTPAPDIYAGLPSWLRMWIPETEIGWVLVLMLAAVGFAMARAGKWVKRF
jgi:hypothetical protein